jgi:hypothetical protein
LPLRFSRLPRAAAPPPPEVRGYGVAPHLTGFIAQEHNVMVIWRKRRGNHYNIVTPTERERRNDEVEARRRRYFAIMIPCLSLVAFGFFVPAPTPARVAALALAAVLPPVAAIVGNAKPW